MERPALPRPASSSTRIDLHADAVDELVARTVAGARAIGSMRQHDARIGVYSCRDGNQPVEDGTQRRDKVHANLQVELAAHESVKEKVAHRYAARVCVRSCSRRERDEGTSTCNCSCD